jgi:hypothetical protein
MSEEKTYAKIKPKYFNYFPFKIENEYSTWHIGRYNSGESKHYFVLNLKDEHNLMLAKEILQFQKEANEKIYERKIVPIILNKKSISISYPKENSPKRFPELISLKMHIVCSIYMAAFNLTKKSKSIYVRNSIISQFDDNRSKFFFVNSPISPTQGVGNARICNKSKIY